ncbi:LysR family transcriptional regulator [Bdellovibrio sp. 22V]|uniref:LysR family transcriptional regulator n=1 Tax=Bdellovibrio TaxID=958 RepID=UPI00254292C9|nr:LysR family transcriptional regulator [Bdellovibrio sp. 22V]WII72616.1 LysR family transcriptional regulator [Bdellovibrio sp. 22V]
MTIDQLETLEMIVEKGSFKAASEHLHKTQPSLSVAIKKLEEEFDLQIFNRQEYRPKLTAEGIVFYNWAKQTLQSFRELKSIGQELGTKKVEPFLTVVLDPLVRFEAIESVFSETVLGKYPTEMTFRSEIMSGGIQSLISGDADFAISTKDEGNKDIESVAFDKIEMIPVVAKSLAKQNATTGGGKFLQRFTQIVVLPQGNKEELLKRDIKGIGAGTKRCYVTDHALKHKMILNGFGWGRLPRNEIEQDLKKGRLIEIKNESVKPFFLDLHIMRLKLKPMGPVARIIWEELLKNCK